MGGTREERERARFLSNIIGKNMRQICMGDDERKSEDRVLKLDRIKKRHITFSSTTEGDLSLNNMSIETDTIIFRVRKE